MNYILSIDGGGTKTTGLLTDETGKPVAQILSDGIPRPALRTEEILPQLLDLTKKLLMEAGVKTGSIRIAVFGVPCFDEYPDEDRWLQRELESALAPALVVVKNDVELAYAAAHGNQPGIHLVAGTGAIALGHNEAGETARANGWHPEFSDYGSGYWLGMQTLGLFTKEADLSEPRGALYTIVRARFQIQKDMEIAALYRNQLAGNRKEIAGLQNILHEAATQGDKCAMDLYRMAAEELYLSICGVYQQLGFPCDTRTEVSCSGGLVGPESYLLPYLKERINELPGRYLDTRLTPAEGGILMAASKIGGCDYTAFRSRMERDRL